MAENDLKNVENALEEFFLHDDLLSHKELKTKKRLELKYEWYYFSLSYLYAAQTLINRAIEENTVESKMQIIPAIYNFKHAIELSIKFLYRFIENDFGKNHDIATLHEAVLEKLQRYSGLRIKEYVKNKNSEEITEEKLKKVIDEAIENLSSLVNKYYFQTPLTKILKNEQFFIEDQGNELFRYPEARNITFYFQSVSMINIPLEDLRLIKGNIKEMIFINQLFFSLFEQDSTSKKSK